MNTGETLEERKAYEAQQLLGDLIGKDMALQIEERLAYERGDTAKAAEILTRRSKLSNEILDAEEEYLRREIVAQQVHRKLMHDILDSQGVPVIHGIRAGIDSEIDKKIDRAQFQMGQIQDEKKKRGAS